jgi:ribbon-helix-helix CopG family protein
MRTTIRIDDGLYREVKATAARSGRTIAAVLEDAVRRGLHPDAGTDPSRYELSPLGALGLRPGVDLSSNTAVAEVLDEDVALDALR